MKYLMYFHVMMLEVNNFRKYTVIINKKELNKVCGFFILVYCTVQCTIGTNKVLEELNVTCYTVQ